jgi:hypothetical protein
MEVRCLTYSVSIMLTSLVEFRAPPSSSSDGVASFDDGGGGADRVLQSVMGRSSLPRGHRILFLPLPSLAASCGDPTIHAWSVH